MSRIQISHSPDLQRLRTDGYDIDIRGSYLLVRDVPYVNERREVKRGMLVSTLSLAGDRTAKPDPHTIFFAGDYPCTAQGVRLEHIVNETATKTLDDGLVVNHSFSQKPPRGHYVDYHEKITTYAAMLSGHATVIDPTASAQTNRVEETESAESPFNYLDTASSRAEINLVTKKLAVRRLAIVGLGGTGAYVLDFVAKTPVWEIHTFDGDRFNTHNAFRSPGAASVEELREQPFKTAYLEGIYKRLRRGIVPHHYNVDASNVGELKEMAFVFLCVDKPGAKAPIVEALEAYGIPFVDVGMGLHVKNLALTGVVAMTTSTPNKRDHLRNHVSLAGADGGNDYDTNIQIAELNAFNAALAVVKWKKLFGFYADFEREHATSFMIETNFLVNEDCA